MGTFTNLVFKNVQGRLTKGATTTTGPLSLVLQSLNRFKTYLHASDAKVTNVLTGFTTDSSFISDNLALNGYLNVHADDFVEISQANAEMLKNAISEVNALGVNLTDSNGHVYQMLTGLSGSDVLLATNPLALSASFNTIDGLLDWLIDHESATPSDDNIYAKLAALYVIYVGSEPSQDATMLDLAQAITTASTPEETILGCLQSRVSHEIGGIPFELGVGQVLIFKEGTKYYLNNLCCAIDGSKNTLWDVINNVVESQEINRVLCAFTELATSGVTTADAYVSVFTEFANNKFDSVKRTALTLRQSFTTGGIYGLAKAILNFASAASSITDSSGSLIFTDNAALAPSEYIAGLISTIVEAVGALVSILATIFSRILGAVVGIFAGIVRSVVQALSYDYNSTVGAIVDEEGVAAPASPYGIMQFETPALLVDSVVTDFLQVGAPCVLFEVPGGWLLIGYGTFDTDGTPLTYRYEFHPAIDRSYRNFWNHLHELGLSVNPYLTSAQFQLFEYTFTNDITFGQLAQAVADTIEENDTPWIIDNGEDGLLAISDDRQIRANIAANIALFFAWLYGLNGQPSYTLFAANSEKTISFKADSSAGQSTYWLVDPVTKMTSDLDTNDGLMTLILIGATYSWLIVDRTGLVYDYPADGPSYSDLASIAVNLQSFASHVIPGLDLGYSSIVSALNNHNYVGDPVSCSSNLKYAIKLPEYERSSFFKWIALTAVVTTVVAVGTIVLSAVIRSRIRRAQSLSAAKVYKADDALKANPTVENYKAYKAAVKKNNLLATLTGGTKYSKVNVWNAGSSSEQGGDKLFSSLLPAASGYTDADFTSGAGIDQGEFLVRGVDKIYSSITGSHLLLD